MESRMNRRIKDSVFTMLFAMQKYIRELYLSLHPEDTAISEEDLKTITLETVLVTGILNDLGLQVRDSIIILTEAQSTFTRNLPFRLLLYLAETLDRYVSSHNMNRYSTTPVKIPRPELYVIYTGSEEVPSVLRLSDLFAGKEENPDQNAKKQQEIREKYGGIEIEVHVIRKTGKGDVLDQYIRFCEISDEMRKEYGPTIEAVKETINQCLEEGVLTDFLSSREVEVEENMKYMFDVETALLEREKELREESWKAGQKDGWEKGQKAGQKDGEQSGIEKGIRAMVEALKDVYQSRERIAGIIADKFSLHPQAAADKVALYW